MIVLRCRQGDERPFRQDQDAPGGLLEKMAKTSVQEAHGLHGWRLRPPVQIDHKDGMYPVYYAPRALGRGRGSVPEADVIYAQRPVAKDGESLNRR